MDRPMRIFPKLYDISDFLVTDHPIIHPESSKYNQYWVQHEKKCLEGMWGHDYKDGKGGWRYMPGHLYWYVNFCEIADEDDEGNTTANIRPLLRDVEWMFAYAWSTARGFSGFEGDDEITCCDLVKRINEKGYENLNVKFRKKVDKIKPNITKPDGSWKEYMDPYEYLKLTHPKAYGRPLYDNDAKNLFWLGSRGSGKSYGASNMAVGHEFNFFGKRYFDDAYIKRPSGVEIFVGSAIASKSQDFLDKFEHTQEYIKTHHGAWGSDDDFIPGYFSLNVTGSLKPNAKSIYRHEYRYKQGGTWTKSGSSTKIHHGTFTTENPQAAVGTRPTVIVVEEAGLCHNLLEVHAANETAQIRRNKFGSTLYIGTGGNIEKIVEPQIIFEDPEAYSCVPFPDVWENRMKPIGFFLPSYYVDNDFKDAQGNTDVQSAFEYEMQERKKREESRNSHALDGYIMARPIKPSEMFLSRDARIFPVTKLRKRLAEINDKDLWELKASIGELKWISENQVKWQEDVTRKKRPILDLSIDKLTNIAGSIVIYEHPDSDTPKATYQKSLYKVVYDPVKDDEYGTSLASVLVYKGYPSVGWNRGMTDTIVAEYIGRHDDVEKIHEIVIKMATYYNAKVLPETNINDFVRYCKRKKMYHMLQLSPYEAISKAIKNPGRKYEVGVQITAKHLKTHCEQLIRSWLLQEIKTENGETLHCLDKIYSRRLLLELIHYNRKGNFDHVSSMMLLVLWLYQEQEYKVAPKEEKSDVEKRREEMRKKLLYRKQQRKRPFHVY